MLEDYDPTGWSLDNLDTFNKQNAQAVHVHHRVKTNNELYDSRLCMRGAIKNLRTLCEPNVSWLDLVFSADGKKTNKIIRPRASTNTKRKVHTARKFKISDCTEWDKLNEIQQKRFKVIFDAVENNPTLLIRYNKHSPELQRISGREYHHFVVKYAHETNLSYYVDYSTYPHKALWDIKEKQAKSRITQGDKIIKVHLYASYRVSTRWNGTGIAPHARGLKALCKDGTIWPFATWNFFIWMESVAGYDAFDKYREASMESKRKSDTAATERKTKEASTGKQPRKKRHNFTDEFLQISKQQSRTLLKSILGGNVPVF